MSLLTCTVAPDGTGLVEGPSRGLVGEVGSVVAEVDEWGFSPRRSRDETELAATKLARPRARTEPVEREMSMLTCIVAGRLSCNPSNRAGLAFLLGTLPRRWLYSATLPTSRVDQPGGRGDDGGPSDGVVVGMPPG